MAAVFETGTPDEEAKPLLEASVMSLAQEWYGTAGPFAGHYAMRPMSAVATDVRDQWAVRFRVDPDTYMIYVRRFAFECCAEPPAWRVIGWSEDPNIPDGLLACVEGVKACPVAPMCSPRLPLGRGGGAGRRGRGPERGV